MWRYECHHPNPQPSTAVVQLLLNSTFKRPKAWLGMDTCCYGDGSPNSCSGGLLLPVPIPGVEGGTS